MSHLEKVFWLGSLSLNSWFQINVSAYAARISQVPISQFVLAFGVDIEASKTDLGAECQASDFEKKKLLLICLALVSH